MGSTHTRKFQKRKYSSNGFNLNFNKANNQLMGSTQQENFNKANAQLMGSILELQFVQTNIPH